MGVGHVVAPDELDVLSDGDAVGGKFPQPGVFFGEQGLLQFAKRPDEGGGEAGGRVVCAGTPQAVAGCPGSVTGGYLRG